MTRLIDADALKKAVIELAVSYCQDGMHPDDLERDLIKLFTNAPTVQREGWVSVPIEPTEEMKDKAWQAYIDSNKPAPYNMLADAYKAMLSASPKDTE